MATSRPRLQITIPPGVKEAYDNTAKIMGVSTSKLAGQVLSESIESVIAIGQALEAVKAGDPKAMEGLVQFSKSAEAQFKEKQEDLLDVLSKK